MMVTVLDSVKSNLPTAEIDTMIVTVLDFVKSNLPTAEIDTMIVTVLDVCEKVFTHGRD